MTGESSQFYGKFRAQEQGRQEEKNVRYNVTLPTRVYFHSARIQAYLSVFYALGGLEDVVGFSSASMNTDPGVAPAGVADEITRPKRHFCLNPWSSMPNLDAEIVTC